jgi:hypothetical protein
MVTFSRLTLPCFAAALALNMVITALPGQAALEVVIGARSVVQNKPMSDCSARAKSALDAVLHNAFEAGTGSGQWIGAERLSASAEPSAEAVIECHAAGDGYTASFTCAAEVPPSPNTATALCDRLTTAFGTQTTAVTGGSSWE